MRRYVGEVSAAVSIVALLVFVLVTTSVFASGYEGTDATQAWGGAPSSTARTATSTSTTSASTTTNAATPSTGSGTTVVSTTVPTTVAPDPPAGSGVPAGWVVHTDDGRFSISLPSPPQVTEIAVAGGGIRREAFVRDRDGAAYSVSSVDSAEASSADNVLRLFATQLAAQLSGQAKNVSFRSVAGQRFSDLDIDYPGGLARATVTAADGVFRFVILVPPAGQAPSQAMDRTFDTIVGSYRPAG